MVIHTVVDPKVILHTGRALNHTSGRHTKIAPPHACRYGAAHEIPKYVMPKSGIPANSAYQLIHDELEFDGKPQLNVASFVTTYMEPEADKLMMENINKNLADNDEYPALVDLQQRCVSMIGHLWGARGSKAIGTACTGSSEAIQLGGLAMKRRWIEKRQAAGKDYSKPNILMAANAQVALEKFARYFDVEARIIPVTVESKYCLDVQAIPEYIDENTIGIFVILGSTYTGHYEPVEEVAKLLDEYEKKTGIDIPIHVDGASGGMFCPFVTPSVKFNFEIERVKSINTSGHKFGLVYPGLGWIIWRDEEQLPAHLRFELHYLGGTEETYTLNFSRPGGHVVAQYFNFLHLGFEGYATVQRITLENARLLSFALELTGYYKLLSEIHRIKDSTKKDDDPERYMPGLPVVSFRLTDEFKKDYPEVSQAAISTLLRSKGWIVPNYPLPPNEEKTEILRVVVRESFTSSMCDRFVEDICAVTQACMHADAAYMLALSNPEAKLTPNDLTRHVKRGEDTTSSEKYVNAINAKQDQHAKALEEQKSTGIYRKPC